jgi:hypothetical protein
LSWLRQGSDEWHAARCGLLTASEMKLIITPTLKVASNDKERAHLYELLAQRITNTSSRYVSDDMLRGQEDEVEARILYAKPTRRSPTCRLRHQRPLGLHHRLFAGWLVGDDGQIECKSRRQKYQVQTIVENVPGETIPDDYMIQVQTGLLVTERQWCDLVSYSGGLPMVTMRVYPGSRHSGRHHRRRRRLRGALAEEDGRLPRSRRDPRRG